MKSNINSHNHKNACGHYDIWIAHLNFQQTLNEAVPEQGILHNPNSTDLAGLFRHMPDNTSADLGQLRLWPDYSDTCRTQSRTQHRTCPPMAGLFWHMPDTMSDTTSDNSAYGRVIPTHAGNNIGHNIGQLRLCSNIWSRGRICATLPVHLYLNNLLCLITIHILSFHPII